MALQQLASNDAGEPARAKINAAIVEADKVAALAGTVATSAASIAANAAALGSKAAQNDLTAEVQARQAADATEVAARTAAVAANTAAIGLKASQADLTAEVQARQAADTTEVAARIAAVAGEAMLRSAADGTEALARQDGDAAEARARQAADDAERDARLQDVARLLAAVADEQAQRVQADAVEADARASAVATEAFTRTAADRALSDRIDKKLDAAAAQTLRGRDGGLYDHDRPGDGPHAFTADPAPKEPSAYDSLDGTQIVDGRYRLSREGYVASKRFYAVEPDEIYPVRFAFTRTAAPIDPNGDTLRVGLLCHDAQRNLLAEIPLQQWTTLPTGARQVAAFAVSRSAATGNPDVVVLPAGTERVRTFVRAFGGTQQTDAELISWNGGGRSSAQGPTADNQATLNQNKLYRDQSAANAATTAAAIAALSLAPAFVPDSPIGLPTFLRAIERANVRQHPSWVNGADNTVALQALLNSGLPARFDAPVITGASLILGNPAKAPWWEGVGDGAYIDARKLFDLRGANNSFVNPTAITIQSTQLAIGSGQNSGIVLTVDAKRGSDFIKVADTTGLYEGQVVRITSNGFFDGLRLHGRIGELNIIEAVYPDGTVAFRYALRFNYNVVERARIHPRNAPITPIIENIGFLGKDDLAAGDDQTKKNNLIALTIRGAKSAMVNGCWAAGFGFAAFTFPDCIDTRSDACTTTLTNPTNSGYGYSVGGASRNTLITRHKARGNRHAITTGGSSGIDDGGPVAAIVYRLFDVNGGGMTNTGGGQCDGVDTHSGSDDFLVEDGEISNVTGAAVNTEGRALTVRRVRMKNIGGNAIQGTNWTYYPGVFIIEDIEAEDIGGDLVKLGDGPSAVVSAANVTQFPGLTAGTFVNPGRTTNLELRRAICKGKLVGSVVEWISGFPDAAVEIAIGPVDADMGQSTANAAFLITGLGSLHLECRPKLRQMPNISAASITSGVDWRYLGSGFDAIYKRGLSISAAGISLKGTASYKVTGDPISLNMDLDPAVAHTAVGISLLDPYADQVMIGSVRGNVPTKATALVPSPWMPDTVYSGTSYRQNAGKYYVLLAKHKSGSTFVLVQDSIRDNPDGTVTMVPNTTVWQEIAIPLAPYESPKLFRRFTANAQVQLPPRKLLTSIIIQNLSATAVAGLKIGTAAGGSDLMPATDIPANGIVRIDASAIATKTYATILSASAQAVAWNGATLIVCFDFATIN